MKLIVDEMPKYAKDCLFVERKYGDPDAFLRCKIDNNYCALYFEQECPCLMVHENNPTILKLDYGMSNR